ncbi:hypothetical protein CBQ26_00595 [Deinococcus indicus]|uniref:Uncharacterized protein n=1 Tax=Deinococcus indicus TaxID=223556 RepID=A0A246BTJ6_9DEIO|nr:MULTISPECIES: hypothetical protein [Deinococcus]MCD0165410.1 hypothetical protein [Deinococcus sp. 12RED42]OWL98991.1 hypothetical protein CBQ26_00595 [Deinococcus indicus]
MITVTPAEVPQLIPDAPADVTDVTEGHLTLAALWVAQRLAERNVSDTALDTPQRLAARTAIAAKALELRAGTDSGITLHHVATSGPAKVIESIKIPDELEVKYRAAASKDETLTLTSTHWAGLAEKFLLLAFPSAPRRPLFPGAAR